MRDGWYAPEHLDQLQENFHSLLQNARSFGITEFHEGRRLEEDETEFIQCMKPYQVATLESPSLRVIVAPEMSGRIISIIDKATATDVVHHPDPGERRYPDLSGGAVFVYSDYVRREPYDAIWKLELQPGPWRFISPGHVPMDFR